MALRSTRNAARLVQSLGDLARLDEPEFGLQAMTVDAGELLDDIVLRFAERARAPVGPCAAREPRPARFAWLDVGAVRARPRQPARQRAQVLPPRRPASTSDWRQRVAAAGDRRRQRARHRGGGSPVRPLLPGRRGRGAAGSGMGLGLASRQADRRVARRRRRSQERAGRGTTVALTFAVPAPASESLVPGLRPGTTFPPLAARVGADEVRCAGEIEEQEPAGACTPVGSHATKCISKPERADDDEDGRQTTLSGAHRSLGSISKHGGQRAAVAADRSAWSREVGHAGLQRLLPFGTSAAAVSDDRQLVPYSGCAARATSSLPPMRGICRSISTTSVRFAAPGRLVDGLDRLLAVAGLATRAPLLELGDRDHHVDRVVLDHQHARTDEA